jgi:hypothetical protein
MKWSNSLVNKNVGHHEMELIVMYHASFTRVVHRISDRCSLSLLDVHDDNV